MRRIPILVPLLAILALVVSCSPEDPFVSTAITKADTIKNPAFLRFIHGAVGAPSVDVILGETAMFSRAQGYLEFPAGVNDARYYPVDTSKRVIRITAGGSELASLPISMVAGNYYTAYFYGEPGKYKVLLTSDTLFPTPAITKTSVRIVNLSPDASSLDFHLEQPDAPPFISGLGYGHASNYALVNAHPPPNGTGLWVNDAVTGKQVYGIRPPSVYLVGSSVVTIIMTGQTIPHGEDPFLLFSVFFDNSKTGPYYGSTPFKLQFKAVRFANLIPSGDRFLDVSFLDSTIQDYASSEYFRRNLPPGQFNSPLHVAPLGYSAGDG
jgi:hypothetical protein